MPLPIDSIRIIRKSGNASKEVDDLVVVEEPMEIRMGYGPMDQRQETSIAITMRTPGDDFDLAIGFLFSEGLIGAIDDVLSIKYCYSDRPGQKENNSVRVELIPEKPIDFTHQKRNFFVHSGCGICGKASIDAVYDTVCKEISQDSHQIQTKILKTIPEITRKKQFNFKSTGGIHSAAIFDLNGQLIAIKEDVGRHNAVDKVLGHLLRGGQSKLDDRILFLSGRMGFELIQKASMARIPIVVSVGAPTSLSIELGRTLNMTLVGFIKKDSLNIYSGDNRIL